MTCYLVSNENNNINIPTILTITENHKKNLSLCVTGLGFRTSYFEFPEGPASPRVVGDTGFEPVTPCL
jgi:hypothetical protein